MTENRYKLNKPKTATIIIMLLIAATLAFIWGNSLESVAESSEKSSRVLESLAFVLEPVFGKANVTDHLVRKLAHFTEFGLLGIWLALFIAVHGRARLQSVANCLFFGLSVAVSDEALQLLSGRGSQVTDVLLDFAGAASGIFAVLVVRWSVLRIKKGSERK